jgi:hypothetical protein
VRRRINGLVAAAALFVALDAHGYCRKTTCETCPVDPDTGCTTGGQPLVWPGECVSFALGRRSSVYVSNADAHRIAMEAFDAWQSVTCPGSGGPPSIHVTDAFGRTSCGLAEYSRTGANANSILFRDDEWPYEGADNALGLTSVAFDSVTGEILDADIEINSTAPLSLTDEVAPDHDDLLSILTHEAGHFLGLAHSQDSEAVMRPVYTSGTASLRVPTADDIAGICAIYPPDRRAVPCDFTPHAGFASECPLGVYKGGCAVTRARRPASLAWLAVFGAIALVRRRADRAWTSRRPSTFIRRG